MRSGGRDMKYFHFSGNRLIHSSIFSLMRGFSRCSTAASGADAVVAVSVGAGAVVCSDDAFDFVLVLAIRFNGCWFHQSFVPLTEGVTG